MVKVSWFSLWIILVVAMRIGHIQILTKPSSFFVFDKLEENVKNAAIFIIKIELSSNAFLDLVANNFLEVY